MTTRLYRSTDTGAPVLSGSAGTLITVLDALLINGYNSQTVTSITRSGSTATVNKTAHGFVAGQRVVHSGATQPEYNIEAAITIVDANNYTYTVAGTPATPATGTITAAVAAAGWTKPFSGVNKAVYRMVTTGNTGFYVNIQDNGPGAGGAREARLWGYEVATAQDTGTGQFPTTSQASTGLFLRKSATADTTARAWWCVADGSVFYFFSDTGDFTAPTYSLCFGFGDFYSYKPSDAYSCWVAGRSSENNAGGNVDNMCTITCSVSSSSFLATVQTGNYVARTWTGVGSAVQIGKHGTAAAAYSAAGGQNNGPIGGSTTSNVRPAIAYPNSPDSACLMSPLWIHHDSAIHGYMKGLWAPCHPQPFGHGDTFSGTGNMSGKSFLVLNIKSYDGSVYNGQVFVETSDTWS